MVFSRDCETLAAQAEALRLLSQLFGVPESSLITAIEGLRDIYRADRHAVELLDGMARSLADDDPIALKVDHARLFVGPYEMLAPPYASLHLEAGDRVDGEVTRRIARCYQRAGLALSSDEKRPADHAGYLFEFLYFGAFCFLRDGGEDDFARLERFADAYVLSWMPRLFALMESGADTRYFKSFARLGLDCLPIGL